MIISLHERAAALPPELRQAFERIFYVNYSTGQAVPPATMEAWVVRQFGGLDAVRRQTVVKVSNRLTFEAALFNPLRAHRPGDQGGDDTELDEWIGRELAGGDMFSAPLEQTTADVFGRIRGRFCTSASNVAKSEGWHGLVVFDEPHPLRFSREQLRDYLDVAWRWLAAAHSHDPRAVYPAIVWHCLPKAGASQMHGHMQVLLGDGAPYARPELWRRAAEGYHRSTGRDYFADLHAVHAALGLGVAARAFAHLTPLRQRELVLLADPQPPGPQPDLADTLYDLLRGLIDRLGVRAFNVAILPPPLAATAEDWRGVPVVTRIADRGPALSSRSDLGALELYASGSITVDPFAVAEGLGSPP